MARANQRRGLRLTAALLLVGSWGEAIPAASADLPQRSCERAGNDSARASVSRRLKLNEIAYFATLFGSHVDFGKVKLVKSRFIAEPFRFAEAVTQGSTIHLSPLRYKKNFMDFRDGRFDMDNLAVLARELCRVWQYQHGVNGVTHHKVLQEHSTHRLDVYKYEKPLRGKLTDYRFEQQCKIMFDYLYIRAFKDPDKANYDEVIEKNLAPDNILPLPRHNVYRPVNEHGASRGEENGSSHDLTAAGVR